MYHSFSSQMLSGILSCFHSDSPHRHTPVLAAFITHMITIGYLSTFQTIFTVPSLKALRVKNMSHIYDPVSLKRTGFISQAQILQPTGA